MSSKLPVFPVTYKIYKNEKEKKISGLEDPNFHLDSTTKRSTKKKKKITIGANANEQSRKHSRFVVLCEQFARVA